MTDRIYIHKTAPKTIFFLLLLFFENLTEKQEETAMEIHNNPITLTILLLNTTCPVFANSVDPDQLASSDLDLHCLSLNMWISIKIPDQVIWLAEN